MFGATPYLREDFDISNQEAKEILMIWMSTFDPNIMPEVRASNYIHECV